MKPFFLLTLYVAQFGMVPVISAQTATDTEKESWRFSLLKAKNSRFYLNQTTSTRIHTGIYGQSPTTFPIAWGTSEKADKRLADLLAPGSSVKFALYEGQPRTWKTSKALEANDLPIRPYTGVPLRLSLPPIREVKPRSAPEGAPLVSYRDESTAPTAVQLPTKPLIKLPSLDVQTPLPIPILAQPQKDRASLGDPALEASIDAALKRFTPARTGPVPFAPLNLPDPFENVRHGQLRNPPEENATPPAIPLQKPTAK